MKKLILIVAVIFMVTPELIGQDNGDFKSRSQATKSEDNKKEKEESDEKAFKEGSINVTIGYGYPNMYKSFFKSLVSNNNANSNPTSGSVYSYEVKGIGPAFLKAEYGLSKLIGLGVVIGYSNMVLTSIRSYTEYEYNYSTSSYVYNTYQDISKYTHTSLSFATRLNFHFGTGKKLDPYAGVGVGYSLNQNKFTYSTNNPNQVLPIPASINGVPFYFAFSVGLRYYFTPNIGLYGELGFDKWSIMQGGLAVKF